MVAALVPNNNTLVDYILYVNSTNPVGNTNNITGSGVENNVPIWNNETNLKVAPSTKFYFDGVGWAVEG
jgi:hypothetical protein